MGSTEVIIEPGRQDVIIRRVFDAPRDVVFKAMTDPSLIPSWWGPRRLTTEVDTMEPRPGGRWRFINRDEAGNEYGFKGVYHDVVPNERVVQTFEFEGAPGHVELDTGIFEEQDGKTVFTGTAVYQSVADRDAVIASGMEGGMRETYDRLAEIVEKSLSRA